MYKYIKNVVFNNNVVEDSNIIIISAENNLKLRTLPII